MKLLLGDVCVGDRQGSRSVFLLHFVRLFVDVTFFIPIHDYILAEGKNSANSGSVKDNPSASSQLGERIPGDPKTASQPTNPVRKAEDGGVGE